MKQYFLFSIISSIFSTALYCSEFTNETNINAETLPVISTLNPLATPYEPRFLQNRQKQSLNNPTETTQQLSNNTEKGIALLVVPELTPMPISRKFLITAPTRDNGFGSEQQPPFSLKRKRIN